MVYFQGLRNNVTIFQFQILIFGLYSLHCYKLHKNCPDIAETFTKINPTLLLSMLTYLIQATYLQKQFECQT